MGLVCLISKFDMKMRWKVWKQFSLSNPLSNWSICHPFWCKVQAATEQLSSVITLLLSYLRSKCSFLGMNICMYTGNTQLPSFFLVTLHISKTYPNPCMIYLDSRRVCCWFPIKPYKFTNFFYVT